MGRQPLPQLHSSTRDLQTREQPVLVKSPKSVVSVGRELGHSALKYYIYPSAMLNDILVTQPRTGATTVSARWAEERTSPACAPHQRSTARAREKRLSAAYVHFGKPR